jgi:hypothetical protein
MPLYIGRSTSILFRTLPYVILRMLVYFAFGFLFVLYWMLVYFIGQAGAAIHPYVRVAIWITALILSFPIVRLFKEYFLYVLKIGHVAVITRLALYNSLPEGVGQIEWGKEQVMKRFKETSILFVVDRLVAGVIRSVHSMLVRIGNIFSGVPGMGGLVGLANTVLRFSLTYVDEAVMARNFMRPEETVWQSAKTGLVLYAQSWKEILKTAFVLGLGSISSYIILLICLLVPFLGLGKVYPSFKVVFVIAAFVFAGAIKLALFDPWALTTMVVTYLTETKDKTADRSWEEKLEAVSGKFREIKQKALAEKPVSMPAQ